MKKRKIKNYGYFMDKLTRVGAVAVLIVVIVISVAVAIMIQPKKEPLLTKNLETNVDLFDDVYFDVSTDQDNYAVEEEVMMTATLSNIGSSASTIFCSGCENETSGEKYATFMFYIFDEHNKKIWEESSSLAVDCPDIYLVGPNTFNITINASSSYECSHVWNQTYGANSPPDEYGTPVPPGTYTVLVELRVNWAHYYGAVYPSRHFGNEKTITIS